MRFQTFSIVSLSIACNYISSRPRSKRVPHGNTYSAVIVSIFHNQNNRWKKRSVSVVPMKWGANPSYSIFPVLVNIYAHDGSVTVHHGGVEMGQGINTKVGYIHEYMSLVVRKPVFGVSDLVRHKPSCAITE